MNLWRRAMPPRPSLMVGDEQACRRELGALQAACVQLSFEQLSMSEASAKLAWADLVPRFRALRESLTSEHLDGPICLEAYSLAADCCAFAADKGELLKCLLRLNGGLACGSPREAEFHACAALFFGCGPSGHAESLASLRATPPRLLRHPTMRCALDALAALWDPFAFIACLHRRSCTPLMRALCAPWLDEARALGLCVLAAAFKCYPAGGAAKLLAIQPEQLGALLSSAAANPANPAQLVSAARAFAMDQSELVFGA